MRCRAEEGERRYWRSVRSMEDWAGMMSIYRDQRLADCPIYTTLIRVFTAGVKIKICLTYKQTCNAVITSCCKDHGMAHTRLMVRSVWPKVCDLAWTPHNETRWVAHNRLMIIDAPMKRQANVSTSLWVAKQNHPYRTCGHAVEESWGPCFLRRAAMASWVCHHDDTAASGGEPDLHLGGRPTLPDATSIWGSELCGPRWT